MSETVEFNKPRNGVSLCQHESEHCTLIDQQEGFRVSSWLVSPFGPVAVPPGAAAPGLGAARIYGPAVVTQSVISASQSWTTAMSVRWYPSMYRQMVLKPYELTATR